VAVQFLCDGSTVSGVDFEILSAGYRVSLIKKRIATGMLKALVRRRRLLKRWVPGDFREL